MKPSSIPARITVFTMIPPRGTTKTPPSWHGNARSPSLRRICRSTHYHRSYESYRTYPSPSTCCAAVLPPKRSNRFGGWLLVLCRIRHEKTHRKADSFGNEDRLRIKLTLHDKGVDPSRREERAPHSFTKLIGAFL